MTMRAFWILRLAVSVLVSGTQCIGLQDDGACVRRQSETNLVTGATSRDDNGVVF